MAEEFMISGSTTAASTAWVTRAGAGGSGIVNSAELTVNAGNGVVVSGLTYSLSEGVIYFDILPGFSGSFGPNGTSLTFETRAANYSAVTQLPRVKNYGSGSTLYYTAEGAGAAGNVCHFYLGSGNVTTFLTGTYTQRHLQVDGGTHTVAGGVAAESTTYDWYVGGGTVIHAYSSTQLATDEYVCGGTALFNRGCSGRIVIGAGGVVLIDAIAETFAEIEIHSGGRAILQKATTLSLVRVLPGGELDTRSSLTPATISRLQHARGARVLIGDNITVSASEPLGIGADGV